MTELDVNSDLIGQRKLSSNDEDSSSSSQPVVDKLAGRHRKSTARSRSSIINGLPTLYDQDESISILDYSYSVKTSGLILLKQLDNLTKKSGTPSGALMLDNNINLAVLAKYLTKDGQQLEPDVAWTYDSLITEMADHFKKL